MINEDNAADLLLGLVILAHSLPRDTRDANGDNLADGFEQTIHDLADELGVSHLVDFNAAGEPAQVITVDRHTLAMVESMAVRLNVALEGLPQIAGDPYGG
ncbi:hypothetical protein PQ472_00185 [Lacticaseibacillus pabuli]|uniref:Uncharacterized protein n=1 Tax=Lacticaseibacillus pabuli TaxID=3025672 RepID=A0ABY7WSH7_9LACO|nr:hypothetical protein [Lacticaseibacillus sp. KACC 23028]WDF82691.1 hypothetical protein PQ472_00185 [Lacticaseibacillus sp. KACC 23028]